MDTSTDRAAADTLWRRPGAARYALRRLRGLVRVPVTVHEPAPGSVVTDHDVPVTTRDSTILRVNVHRPPGDGSFPTILCTHPYGKDKVPTRRRGGKYRVSFQFRMLRQTGPIRFSSLTTGEAPDPAWWVEQGYVVVNCDLRGAGTSDGIGKLLSAQEGEDVADLVEWAAAQSWSTGAVALVGVSYLAVSQWGEIVEALEIRQPQVSKHLRALNEVGIVSVEPVARRRIYRLEAQPFDEIATWVGSFERTWEARLD